MRNSVNHNSSYSNILEEIINDTFGGSFFNRSTFGGYPPLNISEEDNKYTISLAAPGLSKEKIDITVHDRKLIIKSVLNSDTNKVDNEKEMIRREYNFNDFERSISLSEDFDTSDVSATYNNGVLAIDFTKKPKKSDSSISVDIN